MHRNPGYVYNFASLYSQNSKFSDSTRRGTQGGDKSNTIIMQRNEVRRTSPPMDKKQNSTPGDDEDDDDDENSSTSRYSTADSSPVEETGPDINKKLEVKDDVMDNQTSNNNYDKQKNEFEKSPQNLKVDHQNLTRPTMNRQSVTLEFRTIVQRDEYGYGFRVCGNKPVSVHNVRKGKLFHNYNNLLRYVSILLLSIYQVPSGI
ncbi:unnamed protein product [Trichobilharzia regenti]|nr:unnamed protein product [Trichobilharzia regenti]